MASYTLQLHVNHFEPPNTAKGAQIDSTEIPCCLDADFPLEFFLTAIASSTQAEIFCPMES
jgi:hypothetical protein